jgi:C4-dicarboxylate-binding protein DctP
MALPSVCLSPESAPLTARDPGHASRGCSIVLCVLIWVLCIAEVPRAHAQGSTLHLGLPISSDSPTGENLREFARQVAARTGGAVRIEIQGENQSYDEEGVVYAVASGAIEMGATPLSRFARDVPLAGAFLQPFLFNFDALVQAATNHDSEIRALIDGEILRRTNARVLWWQPYGSTVILAKTVLAANPAAIATRLVGSPDKQMRDLIRVCGGAPTPVSPTSLSAALQDGTVAAAAADIMNVREHDLWRVARTVVDLRHAPSLFMIVINDDAWQKLSSEHRAILVELAQDAQAVMWARFAAVRAQAYAFASRQGMRIVELAPEDVAAWRACSAPLLEEYSERTGEAGARLFAAYGKLRTAPCCRDAPGKEMPFFSR